METTIASEGEPTPPPTSYDARSIRLHWVTAALVVALWCLGQTIDWFPKSLRIAARSTHISLGVAVAIVLCTRVWWRLGPGRRLPSVGTGLMRTLSNSVHCTLYVLIAGTVSLGLFCTWVRGDNFFDLLKIPSFDLGNKPLRSLVEDLHALFANVLIGLSALHAASGLAHHVIWKDDVLRRMWPGQRSR